MTGQLASIVRKLFRTRVINWSESILLLILMALDNMLSTKLNKEYYFSVYHQYMYILKILNQTKSPAHLKITWTDIVFIT